MLPLASLPRIPSALRCHIPAALPEQIPGSSGEVTSSWGDLCWGEGCCCSGVCLAHPVIPGSQEPRESPNGQGSCSHPLCGSCAVRFPEWGSSSQLAAPGKGNGKNTAPPTVKCKRRDPKASCSHRGENWFAVFLISRDNRQRWGPGRRAFPGVHTGP